MADQPITPPSTSPPLTPPVSPETPIAAPSLEKPVTPPVQPTMTETPTPPAPVTPENPAINEQPSSSPAQDTPPAKSGGSKAVIIGAIVVLLVGALGAGFYFMQYNQSIQALPTPSPRTTPRASVAPVDTMVETGKIVGTICKDTRVKTKGKLTAFNTEKSRSYPFTIAEDVDTFTLDLDPGKYTLYFTQDESDATIGHTTYQECSKTSTECADHSLVPIVVTANETNFGVLVCDASADISKVATY